MEEEVLVVVVLGKFLMCFAWQTSCARVSIMKSEILVFFSLKNRKKKGFTD